MKDNFDKNLKEVAGKLSGYLPDKDLWQKISNELDFDTRLRARGTEMPLYNHKNDLWEQINTNLSRTQKSYNQKLKRKIAYSVVIAASVALIIFLVTSENYYEDVIVSEEYIITEPFINLTNTETPPIEFIKKWCSQAVETCSSPAFKEEMNRLMEIEKEIQGLNEIMGKYGNSPSLIKSLIKMENEKAMLVKVLLKNLRT